MTAQQLQAALVKSGVSPALAKDYVEASPFVANEILKMREAGAADRKSFAERGTAPHVSAGLIGAAGGAGSLISGDLTGDAVIAATDPGAGSGTAAAGSAAAGGAATKAATAAKTAAKAAATGLTKDVLAGGLAVGIGELAKAYGVRILEVVAGAGLIYFGLLTIAKGGNPPSIPKAIPVPV